LAKARYEHDQDPEPLQKFRDLVAVDSVNLEVLALGLILAINVVFFAAALVTMRSRLTT